MVLAAVDAVRNFVKSRQLGKGVSLPVAVPGTSTERRRLEAAERYIAARVAGRNDEVLSLVTDDVELTSSRDGKVVGKNQFRSYLSKVKPSGIWKAATWNRAIGKAEILGNVKILMVNVGVVAHFGFNRSGKINRISVGTRRKLGANEPTD